MLQVTLNGENAGIDDGMNLLKLIESYRLRPELIAVELNRKIVPRDEFESINLKSGDKIEIVHMVGGGSL